MNSKNLIFKSAFVIFAISGISGLASASVGKKNRVAPLATPAVTSNIVLEIKGSIYPQDSFPAECSELLRGARCNANAFGHYFIQSKKEGELVHSRSTFTAPEGEQVIEESWDQNGHVQKAVIENRALQKYSELEVSGGKVHYKTRDMKDGSVKTSEDDAEENLVVPSTVMSYIRPYFKELSEGKEVKLKVAVLDRRESFSFTMKKIRDEKTVDGEAVMVLQMAPVSFIVKALVDPMSFFVKPRTGELYAFEGKSALRRKVGDSWQEMKVRTAYEYKVNAYVPQHASNSCGSGDVIFGKESKCEVKAQ